MKIREWIQIPVAPMYEINNRGDVRNIKTGRIIKPWIPKDRGNRIYFELYVGKPSERKKFLQTSLLWRTHGIVPKKSARLVPVIVSRGDERYSFDSCTHAAQFIARREHYSVDVVRYYLNKRREEIFGWKINYQR